MKKIAILSLAAFTLSAGLCFANGSKQSANSSSGSAKTYQMFIRSQYAEWIKELKWYDVGEQRTGIHVDYVLGPEEFVDCYAEVDQRIISGTLPDAVMTKLSQTNVYGPQEVFLDMVPYIKKYAPHIQAYIDANPLYKAIVTNDKGAIYGLCKETPIFADLIGYRADHFRKAGIDASKVITVDDFTNAMRALKKYYGPSNPNYYPLAGRDDALRFAAWFGCPSTISSEASHGVYISGRYKDTSLDIMNPNAYIMVQTMKTWYDEGLINPEWVAGTMGEADWESAMLNGNGSIFYDYYNRAYWFMMNGGPQADPDYDMRVLDFLKDKNGRVMKVTTSLKYNDEIVTAINAKASEQTIEAILTFIDYFYSEEGQVLANYGVEGESFKVNADGSKSFIVDYTKEESTSAGQKRWSFLSDRLTVCKPVDDVAFFKWNPPLIAEAASKQFISENLLTSYVLKFTDEQSKKLVNLYASIWDSQIGGLTEFITGKRPLNQTEWQKFRKEMNDNGLDDIEAIQLEAYRTTYGN
jgi:putative aldouronate transport system substrate-binding protein